MKGHCRDCRNQYARNYLRQHPEKRKTTKRKPRHVVSNPKLTKMYPDRRGSGVYKRYAPLKTRVLHFNYATGVPRGDRGKLAVELLFNSYLSQREIAYRTGLSTATIGRIWERLYWTKNRARSRHTCRNHVLNEVHDGTIPHQHRPTRLGSRFFTRRPGRPKKLG